jgi:hypothetical protein
MKSEADSELRVLPILACLRSSLQKAISQLNYNVETHYYDGTPIPIYKTDWAERIVDCFSIVIDVDRLTVAIQSGTEVGETELAEILPLHPYKDLVEDYEQSDLPIGGPPKVLTDTPKGKTVSEITGIVSLEYNLAALTHYVEIRQHHTWVLVDSLQHAIREAVGQSEKTIHKSVIARFSTPQGVRCANATHHSRPSRL